MVDARFQIKILFGLAFISGIFLVPFINLQLNPSPKTQTIHVSYTYPGASSEKVEAQVTAPLESVLSSLDHLATIESTSSAGKGELRLSFDRQKNIEDIRLEVATQIRLIYPFFPASVTYPLIKYKSTFSANPILLVYALTSTLEPEILNNLVDDELVKPISQIDGVHEVELRGLTEYEWVLKVRELALATLGFTYEDIRQRIHQWTQRNHLGTALDEGTGQMITLKWQAGADLESIPNNLRSLPLDHRQGRMIYMGDVVRVFKRIQPTESHYRVNGEKGIHLVIKSDAQVNQISLSAAIRSFITEQRRLLSDPIEIIPLTDRSAYLKSELSTILRRMLVALSILFVFMLIIYRKVNLLAPIWFGFAATLSLSIIAIYFMGLELHLYSLAGLTLSLGIVLDNLIVMAEHLRHQGRQRIFVALLAATLTTLGAVSIIFFISPEYREQLTDFVYIFCITVGMSLVVALFFMPAMVKSQLEAASHPGKGFVFFFNRHYKKYTSCLSHRRWLAFPILLLTFGLPLFLIPSEIEGEGFVTRKYNEIMDGVYGQTIHPKISKYLGGTLQLFMQSKDKFVFRQEQKEETKLHVRASMPFGGTTDQLNAIIISFEHYLKQFDQIKQFHSRISGPTSSSIEITFKEPHGNGSFPYQLKHLLEGEAIEHGSADFQIYGVGRGFNNDLRGAMLSTHLRLLGYHYDHLWLLAEEIRLKLLKHIRIQEVFINPSFRYFAPEHEFYQAQFKPESLQGKGSLIALRNDWQQLNPDQGIITRSSSHGFTMPIRMISDDKKKNDLWSIQHRIHQLDSATYFKNIFLTNLKKRKGTNDIVRHNQQYQLYLEYDFIGNHRLAERVKEQALAEIKPQLPPGYSISDDQSRWWWNEAEDELLYVILGALLLIVIISAILFNSLRQALIPLILVPPAFIGIFLATHFLDFRFDQGGFAALLLVAGLSVNAGIFIINDHNNIKKSKLGLSSVDIFIRAFNAKIKPIFLMILSTILGLFPFVLFDKDEPFWYALAICTIAGLTFSFLGIVFFLGMVLIEKSGTGEVSNQGLHL